jgi:hypothetical protein
MIGVGSVAIIVSASTCLWQYTIGPWANPADFTPQIAVSVFNDTGKPLTLDCDMNTISNLRPSGTAQLLFVKDQPDYPNNCIVNNEGANSSELCFDHYYVTPGKTYRASYFLRTSRCP